MRREIRRFRSYVSSIWSSSMELPELFLPLLLRSIGRRKTERFRPSIPIFRSDRTRKNFAKCRKIPLFSNGSEGGGGGICAMCEHRSNPVHWSGSARRLLRLSFRPDLFFVSRPNWANRAGLLSLSLSLEPASFLLFQFGRASR